MASPTKQDYVDRVNNNLRTQAISSLTVNATDISRAGSAGVAIYDSIEAGPTTGNLPTTNVIGVDIKSMTSEFAKVFARARQVKFTLTGNVPPAGSSYTKVARVTAGAGDPSYTGPDSGHATFSALDPGQAISLTAYDSIITTLGGVLTTHTTSLVHNINYCHASCHSSCHASRGRR